MPPSSARRHATSIRTAISDLLVTTKVGVLPMSVVTEALDRGAAEAKRRHLTAALSLKGDWRLLEAA